MSRIVSLLPAATEIVAALGAESALVGITHACDYPGSIQHLPRVTTPAVDSIRSSATIDAAVRHLQREGRAVVTVDVELLRTLEPTVLLAQDLCDICAIGDDQVRTIAELLDPAPPIVVLSGTTVEGVYDDIQRIARQLDLEEDGDELVTGMRHRFHRLAAKASAVAPRVVSVEWLDPLYLSGHWVPELVGFAGGEEVGASVGERSGRRAWAEVAAMEPDVILMMLCGFDLRRAQAEWAAFARANPTIIAMIGSARVAFVDGNAYTSRPGPRLVDGAEAIQRVLAG